jgi:DNA-directed RNA polymerase subunit E'/Rpb7
MDTIFFRVLLNDRVKLEPRFLGKNFKDHIIKRLKDSFEGKCSKHGYIKTNSIEVYKIAPGNVELISLNGSIVYDVYYYAEVCNPVVGSIIKSQVTNVNKFGILAEVQPILEIIIAKNSVNIQSDPNINLDVIKPGDMISIEIVGKKFELNDKKISIVGRVVGNGNKSLVRQKVTKNDDTISDDEGVEDDVVEEEVETQSETPEKEEDADEFGSSEEEEDEFEDENDDESEISPDKGGGRGAEFFASDNEDEYNHGYDFYSDGGDDAGSEALGDSDDE